MDDPEYTNQKTLDDDNEIMGEEIDTFEDVENSVLPGVDDVPLFANEEVRAIHQDTKDREVVLEKISKEISEMKERTRVMKEHHKNVQQELDNTNSLFNAKTSEIKTESHLRQLASRALGKAKTDSKSFQQHSEELQTQLNSLQNSIYKSNEKLDEFKMQMNWNQEKLEEWAVAARQKEEDNLALQKYTRSDEQRIKELNLQMEQLSRELLVHKDRLDNEITETQAKQMELDRIANDFKDVHSERQAMVSRWQETINEMKARDVEINKIGEKFASLKIEKAQKEGHIVLHSKRLSNQHSENKEVESKSDLLTRLVTKKREEMTTGSLKLQEFRDELESLKNELSTSAEALVSNRIQNQNKSKGIEERRVMLERERQKYHAVKAKVEKVKNSADQAEVLARMAEEELQKIEKEASIQLIRTKTLKERLFRETQLVQEMKREESALRSEITGTKSLVRNLEFQLLQLDKEASKQQELLYNAEFQIQQIERKVARGMGERSDEEKKRLKAQIEASELALEDVKEKRKLLLQQTRKLQNELVSSRLNRENLIDKNAKSTEVQKEKELENKTIEDEIRRDTRTKQDLMVQNDVLKLEVKRVHDLLSAKTDAVFSLENRKQQLILSMEERKLEISVHKDVLKAELRSLNDEKHKLILDLRAREAVVEKLKARFESVARSQDEDPGHSQSYFIIQAAQKREELQRKGDELDTAIRVAERELRALQTTLDHLNARNMAYRESFKKVELVGDEADILKKLEERTKMGKEALFKKKKEMQRVMTDIEEDGRRLEQVKSQQSRVSKQKEHLDKAKAQVGEELLNQETQLADQTDKITKLTLKHRTKCCQTRGGDLSSYHSGSLEEKSVRADVLKDAMQNVLYTLGQLSNEFPEVSDLLTSRLAEADLRIPLRPVGNRTGTAGTSGSGDPYSTSSSRNNSANASRGGGGGGGGGDGYGYGNGGGVGSGPSTTSIGSSGSGGGRKAASNGPTGRALQPRSLDMGL